MDRELLEAPFAPEEIRSREGSHGETLDYVPGFVVIRRLNDSLGGDWSFEVVDHQIHEDEVAVLGRLAVNGIAKMQFGTNRITRGREDGLPVSMGDDLKGAATDALKKCATLLGVGLHLYDDGAPSGNGNRQPDPGPRPATEAQIRAIYAIGADRGLDRGEVQSRCRNAFGMGPEDLSLKDASDFISELKALSRPRRTA